MEVGRNEGGGVLGYWIGRPYWGRGFATAGSRTVLEFGFRELGLSTIRAMSLVENPASCRVLEKLGFVRMGAGPEIEQGPTVSYELTAPAGREDA